MGACAVEMANVGGNGDQNQQVGRLIIHKF
jgi:hypothetical protein